MIANTRILIGFFAALLMMFATTAKAASKPTFMISAANIHAAKAGQQMLAKGGSAIDAAIATQMVLTLVEPQSSGIGGGAFMLHFDAKTKKLETYDGREMAPAAVKEDHFLKDDGTKMQFYEAVVGGLAVGAPGVLAMMKKAHQEHGELPWKDLFAPAIMLAEGGFAISERLHYLLNRDKFLITKPVAAGYFYQADGTAKPEGTILKNPELAASLKLIAENGIDAFYKGSIAKKIVAAVQGDKTNPGLLSMADLSAYHTKKRQPVCAPYRQWKVCGMGPPTSGGITSLQILGMLESQEMGALAPGGIDAIHLISEASALAFADRGRYLADADFVGVPVKEMLDKRYLLNRANLINLKARSDKSKAGKPYEKHGYLLSPDRSPELPSTSHFSIVDANGNAISMTTSVENAFGSRLMAGGFILNNQLTDFSFTPIGEDGPVNNRIQPGKRPRSSMSPSMVFNSSGDLKLVIGSPGGSRIIGYVTKTIVAVLDWGLDIQSAINLPHHVNRNGSTDLEKERNITAQKADLDAMGHKVKIRVLNSGLHGIEVIAGGLRGGADRRREGVVLSQP